MLIIEILYTGSITSTHQNNFYYWKPEAASEGVPESGLVGGVVIRIGMFSVQPDLALDRALDRA